MRFQAENVIYRAYNLKIWQIWEIFERFEAKAVHAEMDETGVLFETLFLLLGKAVVNGEKTVKNKFFNL